MASAQKIISRKSVPDCLVRISPALFAQMARRDVIHLFLAAHIQPESEVSAIEIECKYRSKCCVRQITNNWVMFLDDAGVVPTNHNRS